MQTLDLMLRGAAIGASLFVGARLILGAVPPRKWVPLMALALCVSCYLIVSSPYIPQLPAGWENLAVAGAILTPLALTWTALELLFDGIRRHWIWLAFAAASAAAGLVSGVVPVLGVVHARSVALLYLGLLVLAAVSTPDDLVESRRRFRRGFVVAFGGLGVIIAVVEISFDTNALPDAMLLVQASAFVVLTILFGVWSLSPEAEIWCPAPSPKKPVTQPGSNPIIASLLAAMKDGAWRTEGLTIGTLAADLGVPEHRLRAAINRELGFRNFSAFINGYRIEGAMRDLDDVSQSDRTILQIAYESGFASLGPFNRAFREHTGSSPREYRNRPRKGADSFE